MEIDRLIFILEHEANSNGKLDYKHQVVVALKECGAISRKLAEVEAQREWLKDAIANCLEYANGRESEWGNRAMDTFKILKEALIKLEEK